jgi:hypothetical protein
MAEPWIGSMAGYISLLKAEAGIRRNKKGVQKSTKIVMKPLSQ